MLGYVTIDTNDHEKALAFYDALLGSIGHTRVFDDGYFRDLDGNKLNAFIFA